jgi:hypothetical protein
VITQSNHKKNEFHNYTTKHKRIILLFVYIMEKQTIAFTIILFSLLFVLNTLAYDNNNSTIFAQDKNTSSQMMSMGQATGIWEFIPSMTNWIGIFSLGMMSALLAFKTNNSSSIEIQRRRIIISIAILSMAAGTIHILLIHEHIQASFWWGMFFLISGGAQVIYGIIIGFVKKSNNSTALYYIGIVGNVIMFVIFILARLVTPPFSPEGTPENELDPNGIITLIIEAAIAILLTYILKYKQMRTIIK